FIFELEKKEGLGRGFRCGFLGSLHAEIICERLFREFGLKLVISTPSVVYKIINNNDKEVFVFSPSDWPDQTTIRETEELWVLLEVMTPANYVGQVFEVLETLEGRQVTSDYIGKDKVILKYEVPLRKIIAGFYDNLKGATQGYASMNYSVIGYRKGDLVKLDILVAGKKEDVFTKIVSKKEAEREGRKIILKLKEVMPAQLFSVSLQAVISGKIVARENISSRGKDVIAGLYGGDYSRKRKQLEKQKKGKKELKAKGEVRIPAEVYLNIFRS
ncbi:elongation factor 4, partial [Candidatus Parcubacteria bacterium A4]